MNNLEVREVMKRSRLFGYEVAEALGISETHFSRKLRKELPVDEKEKILAVIEKLANGGER